MYIVLAKRIVLCLMSHVTYLYFLYLKHFGITEANVHLDVTSLCRFFPNKRTCSNQRTTTSVFKQTVYKLTLPSQHIGTVSFKKKKKTQVIYLYFLYSNYFAITLANVTCSNQRTATNNLCINAHYQASILTLCNSYVTRLS